MSDSLGSRLVRPAPLRLRQAAGWLFVILAALVWHAACSSPASRYPDSDRISTINSFTTKSQVRTTTNALPVWRLQVEEVSRVGSGDAALPDARLAWRTLFGIRYGETVIEAEQMGPTSFDAVRYFGVLVGFVVIEVVVVGLGFWLVAAR